MDSIHDHITANGYNFEPIFDGNFYRFQPPDRSDRSGWFVGKAVPLGKEEYKILTYGDFSKHEHFVWHSKKRFAKEEKKIKEKAENELLAKKEEERRKLNKEAADKAREIISKNQKPSKTFSYFLKKGIEETYDLVTDGGKNVIIPVYSNFDKTIVGYQKIQESGDKRFLLGTKKQGSFYFFPGNSSSIYICEGWATGEAIHRATENMVIVAFDVGNLFEVTKITKEKFENSKIIIACDNDQFTRIRNKPKNPGVLAGIRCSNELGVGIRIPQFKDLKSKPSDFNDLLIWEGLAAVKEQLIAEPKKEKIIEHSFETIEDGFFHEIEVPTPNGPKIIYKPDYIGCAKYFKHKLHYVCSDSWTYKYSDGQYCLVEDLNFKAELYSYINNRPTIDKPAVAASKNFKDQITGYCSYKESDFKSTLGKINLKNGILDIKTKKMEPHDPKYFFKYRLDHNYDPKAECPLWESTLLECLEDNTDLIGLMSEIFGYTLLGGYPFAHKSFLFRGDGRDGKSLVFNVLKALLGKQNYSTISMGSLDEKFERVELFGKIANIVGESPTSVNNEMFKTIVGGDEIMASYKHKNVFRFPCEARLFFAANLPPKMNEATIAMFDRIIIIPFNRSFTAEEQDTSRSEKIIASDLPGILNWALQGLDRFLARGHFYIPPICELQMKEFKRQSDSVHNFAHDCVQIITNPKEKKVVKIRDFYPHYLDWCKENNRPPTSLINFSKKLAALYKRDLPAGCFWDDGRFLVTSSLHICVIENFAKTNTLFGMRDQYRDD